MSLDVNSSMDTNRIVCGVTFTIAVAQGERALRLHTIYVQVSGTNFGVALDIVLHVEC